METHHVPWASATQPAGANPGRRPWWRLGRGEGSPSVFRGDDGSNGDGSTTTSWTESTTPAYIARISKECPSNRVVRE